MIKYIQLNEKKNKKDKEKKSLYNLLNAWIYSIYNFT